MGVQSSVFDRVVEQDKVFEQLEISASNPLHAYFFVGPRGSCRWEAAKGFAALILSDGLDRAEADRVEQRRASRSSSRLSTRNPVSRRRSSDSYKSSKPNSSRKL